MDRAEDIELDQLMQRASASVQESLNVTVDVEQRLRNLLCEAGVQPGLAHADRGSAAWLSPRGAPESSAH